MNMSDIDFLRKMRTYIVKGLFVFAFIFIYLTCADQGKSVAHAGCDESLCVPLPVIEECEGLGGLADSSEDSLSLFNISPEALEFQGSYYDQLDEISQDLYDQFLDWYAEGADVDNSHMVTFPVEISDATIEFVDSKNYKFTDERIQENYRDYVIPAMLALMYDHPELPWLVNSRYKCSISPGIEGTVVSGQKTVNITSLNVTIIYLETNVGTKAGMDAAIQTAQIAIGDTTSQYELLKKIHDYLADIIVYNNCAAKASGTVNGVSRTYTSDQNNAYQTAYSAFYTCNNDDEYFGEGHNYTVCAGYARGFKVLCDYYGIPCIYVTGNSVTPTEVGNHAWNYVLQDGNWYAVDCTWDDQTSGLCDTYFMVGSASSGFYSTFSEEHVSVGNWIATYPYTFFYPELALVKYCIHEDCNSDSKCDICGRIIAAEFAVTQEGWVYGKENPPLPSVTVTNDDKSASDCSFLYKLKNDGDDKYTDELPINAGAYVVKAVLPKRCDVDFDYPETLAIAEFNIDKADLEVEAPEIENVIYKKGLKLSDISLEGKGWIWKEPDSEIGDIEVGDKGAKREYAADYILPDENNYNPVSGMLTVTFIPCPHVGKRAVTVTEPTCTAKGLLEYVCEYCGIKADADEIAPLDHDYMWITDKDATTTEEGLRHEECSRCHKRGEEETLPRLETSESSDNQNQQNPGQETGSQQTGNEGHETDSQQTENNGQDRAVLEKGREVIDSKNAASFVITKLKKNNKGDVVSAEVQYVEYSGKASSVVVPDIVKVEGVACKVTSIKAGAFKGNKKIASVTIGKNIVIIDKNAFQNCPRLKKITIKSNKLKTVGKNAFKNIAKNAVIKVPARQLKQYKKLFVSKTGFKKTMKIKK